MVHIVFQGAIVWMPAAHIGLIIIISFHHGKQIQEKIHNARRLLLLIRMLFTQSFTELAQRHRRIQLPLLRSSRKCKQLSNNAAREHSMNLIMPIKVTAFRHHASKRQTMVKMLELMQSMKMESQ